MATSSYPNRYKAGVAPWNKGQKKESIVGVELGATGTFLSGGFLTQQDYNEDLVGQKASEKYDEMRKSDATVRASILAITLPILSANWFIQDASEEPVDKEIGEFVRANFFEHMSIAWPDVLRQALLDLIYGHMVFECVYEWGNDGKIYWKKLAPRLPSSIYSWELSDKQAGIVQYLPDGRTAEIPMWKCLVFVNEKEGDNWQGFSLLRSAYKHWYIKDALYKIDAMTHELQGQGIIYAKYKQGTNPRDITRMDELLQESRANQQRNLRYDENWDVGFLDMKAGSNSRIMESIMHHDRQIMKNVLAMGLDLGSGPTGSFALASSHQQTLMQSLVAYANCIRGEFNRHGIPRLVDLNFQTEHYPTLEFADLDNTAFTDLATAMSSLASAGFLTPDNKIEKYVRGLMELPEKEEPDELASMLGEEVPEEIIPEEEEEETEETVENTEPIEEAAASLSKAAPLTSEERSEIMKRVWDKRGRKNKEDKPSSESSVPGISEKRMNEIMALAKKGKGKGRGGGKGKGKGDKDNPIKKFKEAQKKELDAARESFAQEKKAMRRSLLERKARGEKITPEESSRMQLELQTKQDAYEKKVKMIKAKIPPKKKAGFEDEGIYKALDRIDELLDRA